MQTNIYMLKNLHKFFLKFFHEIYFDYILSLRSQAVGANLVPTAIVLKKHGN